MTFRLLLTSLLCIGAYTTSIIPMDRTLFGDNPDVGMFDVDTMNRLVEATQEKSIPCVSLCNKTGHKIYFILQFERNEPACLTLVPDQTLTLDCSRTLVHLEVNIYGNTKQWFTGKKLTAGRYTPENLAPRVIKGVNSCASKHASVTIEPHDDVLAGGVLSFLLGSSIPYKILKHGLSALLPYKCSVLERARPEEAPSKSILPFFPQVSYARTQGLLLDGLVDPRYILCLPEETTPYGIETAYALMREHYNAQGLSEQQKQHIFRLVTAAYEALTQEKYFEFAQIVKELLPELFVVAENQE